MKTECPIYDCDCPYFKNGYCRMKEMEGTDPEKECDAFFGSDDY